MDHTDSIGLDPNNKPMAWYRAQSPDPILAQHQLSNTLISLIVKIQKKNIINKINNKYIK